MKNQFLFWGGEGAESENEIDSDNFGQQGF